MFKLLHKSIPHAFWNRDSEKEVVGHLQKPNNGPEGMQLLAWQGHQPKISPRETKAIKIYREKHTITSSTKTNVHHIVAYSSVLAIHTGPIRDQYVDCPILGKIHYMTPYRAIREIKIYREKHTITSSTKTNVHHIVAYSSVLAIHTGPIRDQYVDCPILGKIHYMTPYRAIREVYTGRNDQNPIVITCTDQ
ncbi:hypothetical protein C4D60_Mb11t22960 [Musa balbisiana]|uniref:Uncharacterized protein n=1 Tax=Musa balbisiana TaxID=52838 RepID=A0A4S8J639_MUSBA|nr:hypothetical protein C4D60_Mb11t22960 [Musa balbisiana]